jgi:alpha-L-rhamnosidase
MKAAIRELSWNGEFFEENAVRDELGKLIKTGHTTETCQYYAFYFDTASPDEYPELFEKMITQFGPKRNTEVVYPEVYPSNAIVGNYLRLELMIRYGYKEQVLEECCDFFLGMAEMTGTLWEHSRLDASLNHGFASMAAVYIDECAENRIAFS